MFNSKYCNILSKRRAFSKVFVTTFIINLFLFGSAACESHNFGISKKTGLPLPRFVSLKSDKANLRRGPSLDHKIDWVYKRKHLPLKIVSEFGHWRKVTDFEGFTGWMYKDLLSGTRYTIVTKKETLLRNKADFNSLGKAILKNLETDFVILSFLKIFCILLFFLLLYQKEIFQEKIVQLPLKDHLVFHRPLA